MSDFEFSRTLYARVVEENKQLKEENEELRNDMKLFVVDELCEVLYRLKNKDIFLEDYLDKEIRELRSNKADSRVYFLPGRFSGKSAVTRFFKSLLDEKDKKIEELEAEIVRLRCQQNEQDQKIKDLEAKLAESEKQIKDAREAGDMAVDSWCKNRRKYEAQIAEMQNKSFILYSMLYETLEKQGCEDIASQIDQMTGWTYDKEADWFKGNRNYEQLKQQLAEKDGLLEQKIGDMKSTDFIKMCIKSGFMMEAKENDNQTAIEKLEKVKEFVNDFYGEYSASVITNFIDNQINELKGGLVKDERKV